MKQEEIFTYLTTIVVFLIGGIDLSLKILLVFMAIDLLTGMFCGFKNCSFTSKRLRVGLFSKCGYLLAIIIAYQIDVLIFQGQAMTKTMTIFFYLWVELSSIIENFGILGWKVPTIFVERLEKLKDLSTDEKNNLDTKE